MKFAPEDPTDNWSSFYSGNGLVPNRHQAITWTNDDLHWRIYAWPELSVLKDALEPPVKYWIYGLRPNFKGFRVIRL